jgi:hypothetical protein
MNAQRTLETLVRTTLEGEPSHAERDAVWEAIVARLREGAATGRTARPLRMPLPAAVGAAVLAVILAALALLPASDKPGKPSQAAPMPGRQLAAGPAAEAAFVLNATARSSRRALPSVGPGEYLFARTSTVVQGDVGGPARFVTKSWTANDGSALILERSRSRRSCPSSARRATDCRPRWLSGANTTRYGAGGVVGVIHTGDGRKLRVRPDPFRWRSVFLGDELVGLPADRLRLLAALRAGIERFAAEHRKRPDPHRKLGGRDMTLFNIELHGADLAVVHNITEMLVDAPLDPDQRAGMLSLLADAPDWYRPGRSAEPLPVHSLGPTTDALGRDGTAVQVGAADLALDVDGGRLLEIRSFEHGRDALPIVITVEDQRVVGSTNREGRSGHA